MFERDRQLNRENSEGYYQCHVSDDDDHGVIGSGVFFATIETIIVDSKSTFFT